MSDTPTADTGESSMDEDLVIPDRETLVVTKSEIRAALEDGQPVSFTVNEQGLRYTVDVDVAPRCDSEDCSDAAIFEATSGEEFCSLNCMAGETDE